MLQWIPDRPGLCQDAPSTMDVLLRILPPAPSAQGQRQPINLTLVLDRSGSMCGRKMMLTQKASKMALQFLTPRDYFSLVLFDSDVEVLIESQSVLQPYTLAKRIDTIQARGSTALFEGWQVGCRENLLHHQPRHLNRLLLLTDGQANVGETNPDRICDSVHRAYQQGVQTTTLGFGDAYNEVLLRSMAASGGGNHFFVESPQQLTTCFELELEALALTVGTHVRLRFESLISGVRIEDLSATDMDSDGQYILADLVAGSPIDRLFRLSLPPTQSPPLEAVLSWHCPKAGQAMESRLPLELPSLTLAQRNQLPLHPEVERQLAATQAEAARREASLAMNQGQRDRATRLLDQALQTRLLSDFDRHQLELLKNKVETGDVNATNKLSMAQSYSYSRGSLTSQDLDEALFQMVVQQGQLGLVTEGILAQGPPLADRPWVRLEGMLRGLLWCAGNSETAALVLATLPLLQGRVKLAPLLLGLTDSLGRVPLPRPSPALARLKSRLDAGQANYANCDFQGLDCGAVARIAPLVLARPQGGDPRALHFVVMAARITHAHPLCSLTSLGFAALLWDLLASPTPPSPHFYLERFLDVIAPIEPQESQVSPDRGPLDGWQGRFSDYLCQIVLQARQQSLTPEQARNYFGQEDCLLQAIPYWLYLLECHAHQPKLALNHFSSPWVGALLGASLGALHGRFPEWQLASDCEQLLAQLAPSSSSSAT